MNTNAPTFHELQARIVAKITGRLSIGWFDYCSDSHDMRQAGARAMRILCRLRGERITMRQAMWG